MLLDYIRNIILFPGGTSDLVVSISSVHPSSGVVHGWCCAADRPQLPGEQGR